MSGNVRYSRFGHPMQAEIKKSSKYLSQNRFYKYPQKTVNLKQDFRGYKHLLNDEQFTVKVINVNAEFIASQLGEL